MSGTEAVASSPQPRATPSPEPAAAPAWRQADFQAALRQADSRRTAYEPSRPTERPEDDEDLEGGAASEASRESARETNREDAAEGRLEAASGGAGQAQASASPEAPQPAAGLVDGRFAAMLDRLALNAQADRSRTLQLRFADLGHPLSALSIARGADGALSVQLSAHPQAAQPLNRALDTLKQRLSDRGLQLDQLAVSTADGEPLPPVKADRG